MPEKVAVVIGASRGIGLALANILKKEAYQVVATARSEAQQLQALGPEVQVVTGVDIGTGGGLEPLEAALENKQICLLIIAAGTQEVDKLEVVTKDCIRRQMEINAIGPLFAVKALQAKLQRSAKVILISSKNASITEVDATGGELYGYRMSKVALNMAGRTLAGDLKRALGASVALVHPGVVNTEMLRSLRKARGVAEDKLTANTITAEESASKIMGIIDDLTLEKTGTFWAADTGKCIGW